ncbi:unnamed protein product [Nezara viridula]|uniref:BSD domain-containing protein n=1 Tax=Nezara viridula TaxID=85310 RepID=A0A9P0MRZ1_NEZVI|nr:unnamed protein product [Nezara viridula]
MAGNDLWHNMVTAAKNKSVEIAEFVKNDINELSSAVSSEVLYYSDAVKRGASNLLGNVKESLNLNRSFVPNNGRHSVRSFIRDLWSPETIHDDVSPMIIRDSEAVPMTDVQYRHHVLVTEPKNFTEGFSEVEERQAGAWYATAGENLQDVEYLGKQLSECPALADMYRTLVPEQVTHSEFWKRYFFRRYMLFDCYSEEDVGNYYTGRSERSSLLEDIGSFDDNEHKEESDRISTGGDEPFSIEIENPRGSSSSSDRLTNNEFDIETDDVTLYDVISAD